MADNGMGKMRMSRRERPKSRASDLFRLQSGMKTGFGHLFREKGGVESNKFFTLFHSWGKISFRGDK
jgi:hypothetical protein